VDISNYYIFHAMVIVSQKHRLPRRRIMLCDSKVAIILTSGLLLLVVALSLYDNPRSLKDDVVEVVYHKKVKSGWDASGMKLYNDMVLKLSTTGSRNTTMYPPGKTKPFHVSDEVCKNKNFWGRAENGGWERGTLNIFNKYINIETTVVDFGTWIGPTILYHGQFSLRSFGIEADPVAFAVAEKNVELNKNSNPTWGKRVSVDSGCVVRPEDAGKLTMKSGKMPGGSMSGIGKNVYGDKGEKAIKWEVQCYTLPDLFENYWGIQKPYKDVFIKIDIETYECKLIPSFYNWLKDEQFLPKMFISFHPKIDECTDIEYEGVLKFLSLYDHVRVKTDSEVFPSKGATLSNIKSLQKATLDFIVYQNHHVQKFEAKPEEVK